MFNRWNQIVFLCIVVFLSYPAYNPISAQTAQHSLAAIDTSAGNSSHSLFIGAGGGTNMVYLGSSLSNNKPFYAASATYGFRNSLYLTTSATHLADVYPWVAFYDATLTYTHAFNSWFDISANLAGYKTSKPLRDSLFSDFIYADLTAGFDWKLLYTRITFAEVFAQQNGFYLRIDNSRYFETPQFFAGKSIISFDPNVSLLLGNIVSSETSMTGGRYRNAPPFSHGYRKSGGTMETYTEKFGFIDIGLLLPITFSYGKFSLEIEPGYFLPLQQDPLYYESEGFTLNFNLFIKIL
jgi:hypothetical protein